MSKVPFCPLSQNCLAVLQTKSEKMEYQKWDRGQGGVNIPRVPLVSHFFSMVKDNLWYH